MSKNIEVERIKIVKKCKLKKDGFFTWCTAMDKMIHPEANANVKGFVQINLLNFKTLKERCLGVVYKKTHKKNCEKIMLNVCPYCGEKIFNEKGENK